MTGMSLTVVIVEVRKRDATGSVIILPLIIVGNILSGNYVVGIFCLPRINSLFLHSHRLVCRTGSSYNV